VTPRLRLLIFAIAGFLVVAGIAGAAWAFLHHDQGSREGAAVAAELPVHRQAALDPQLPDDSRYVPVYPADTKIVLDESSWVEIGESAGAYAMVTPPGNKVKVYFQRSQDHRYNTEIETRP
jgi:hypothetical protein